jgi:hypothetical protein
VAQDTGGLEVVRPIYEDAGATFTALVDPLHTVSSLYRMVNVPTGVWIDEEGRIVRPPEVAYVKKMALGSVAVNGDAYTAALRDWVAKGSASEFALSPDEIRERVTTARHASETFVDQADATFRLGAYFKQRGDDERAARYWAKAQELNPDSWNYHRQDWSFLPTMAETMKNFTAKVRQTGEEGKVYYAPNELSNPQAEENARKAQEAASPPPR